jgi:hypothetical protein
MTLMVLTSGSSSALSMFLPPWWHQCMGVSGNKCRFGPVLVAEMTSIARPIQMGSATLPPFTVLRAKNYSKMPNINIWLPRYL